MDRSVVYALSLDGVHLRYVGMTCGDLADRMRVHRWTAERGTRRPVYDWMRKHGPENVVVTVLELSLIHI